MASNTTEPGSAPSWPRMISVLGAVGPGGELLGGRGPERVGRGEHDAPALVVLALRELGDARGLPDAVDADEHPDARLRVAVVQLAVGVGEQRRPAPRAAVRCTRSGSPVFSALARSRTASMTFVVVGTPTSARISASSRSSHVSSSTLPRPAMPANAPANAARVLPSRSRRRGLTRSTGCDDLGLGLGLLDGRDDDGAAVPRAERRVAVDRPRRRRARPRLGQALSVRAERRERYSPPPMRTSASATMRRMTTSSIGAGD